MGLGEEPTAKLATQSWWGSGGVWDHGIAVSLGSSSCTLPRNQKCMFEVSEMISTCNMSAEEKDGSNNGIDPTQDTRSNGTRGHAEA